MDGLRLQEEVQRIIIQLQGSESSGLSESDVERIVREILRQELAALKVGHEEDKNQQELAFVSWYTPKIYMYILLQLSDK